MVSSGHSQCIVSMVTIIEMYTGQSYTGIRNNHRYHPDQRKVKIWRHHCNSGGGRTNRDACQGLTDARAA